MTNLKNNLNIFKKGSLTMGFIKIDLHLYALYDIGKSLINYLMG